MSEKDSNTEQEFPEVPPFPYEDELEMLRKMSENAPDGVKQVLELKIKLLEEKEQENNT